MATFLLSATVFLRTVFSDPKTRMSGNNRSLELDTLYARRLFLTNPNNTAPPANYALLANGTGGTYFGNLYGTVPPTGFNAVYLPDSNVSTVANRPYNVLSLKQGTGVSIVLDNENSIVFNTVPIVPSSFSFINTPSGSIYADAMQANFNMEPNYGVNFSVANNRLLIGGNPSFGNIQIRTPTGNNQIVAATTLSSFTLAADFGIDISISSNTTNVIKIGTSQKSFSLNEITIDNLSTFKFGSTLNNIKMTAKGNLLITQQTPSTLNFETHGFSRIVTNTNQIIEASTTSESLTLNRGYGIDYLTTSNALTIKLASTMAHSIQTPTASTIADANSKLNLSAGDSITYSNALNGSLQINTTDFNRIICSSGAPVLSNATNSTLQKQVTFRGVNGLSVTGDPTTNTVSFSYSGPGTVGASYAYSQILLYSSVTSVLSPLTNPYTLNAAPYASATLGIAGVSPILIRPGTSPTESSLFYISIDSEKLLSTTSTTLSSLTSTTNSLASAAAQNTNYTKFNCVTISSITSSLTAIPLMSFNYLTNCVGINKSGRPLTNLVSLDISGTILAHTYATYSDPSLKAFGDPYTLSLSQLEEIQPSHFTWLSNNKKDVGFSAVDVERILPSAVSIGDSGLKLVDYSKLCILSIAALKDANSRIKSLESTVQSLVHLKLDRMV